MKYILSWFVSALTLFIVTKVLPGFRIDSFQTALLASVIIALVNILVKPILLFVTLPITILTFGLFTFVINAVALLLASSLTPGFKIDGLGTALIASILITIISTFFRSVLSL